jgi:hypothetical protein
MENLSGVNPAETGDLASQSFGIEKEETRTREVKEVAEKYRCVFVHGIDQGNIVKLSAIDIDAEWDDRLELCLALEPALSCSTYQEGDNGEFGLWASTGLVLASGRIDSASNRDAATEPKSINERGKFRPGVDIDAKIAEAINERSAHTPNEFSIARPKFSGVYICLDRQSDPDFAEIKEAALAEADKLSLPVYYLRNGEIFTSEDSEEPIDNMEAMGTEIVLPNGTREDIIIKIKDSKILERRKRYSSTDFSPVWDE